MFRATVLPLCVVVLSNLAGQTPNPPCRAAEPVRQAIAAIQQKTDDPNRPYSEIRRERMEAYAGLMKKFPGNFFVRKAWLESARLAQQTPEAISNEMRQRTQALPGDAGAAYLYALSLMGKQTTETLRLLDQLKQQQPEFPWTYFTIAQIHDYPSFKDPATVEVNAARFIELCPENLDAYAFVSRLEKSDFLASASKQLRRQLQGRADHEAIPQWHYLWTMEFKVTPTAEHDPLRKQVAEDLKPLETVDPGTEKLVAYVLREGYRLTGNKAAEDALNQRTKPAEDKSDAVFRQMNEWEKSHPAPGSGASAEAKSAHRAAYLAFVDQLIEKYPKEPFVYQQRLTVLVQMERPEAEIVAAAELFQEVKKSGDGAQIGGPELLFPVATAYVTRGVRLEQVPALVQQALDVSEKERAELSLTDNDLSPPTGEREMRQTNYDNRRAQGWTLLAQAYAKMGQMDRAREPLAKLESQLRRRREMVAEWEKRKADGQAEPKDRNRILEMIRRNFAFEEVQYQEVLAKVALADHRQLDALTFYQNAIRLSSANANTEKYRTPQLKTKAREIWKDLGGTLEAWQSFEETLKPASAGTKKEPEGRFTNVARKLPGFQLPDLAGKTWTLGNLQGKTTFINIWATWCGPCREELPHLQKLYDRLQGRGDVQLITLNVDDNTGLIAPFLKQNGYTFPVILAKSTVEDFLGTISIPRNWLVDRVGVLQLEALGFGSANAGEWIKEQIVQIEALRAGAAK